MATKTVVASAVDLDKVAVALRGNWTCLGTTVEPGEVISTQDMPERNLYVLLSHKHLVAPSRDLAEKVVACECGRNWKDADSAKSHNCPARSL